MATTTSKTALERDCVASDPKHYTVDSENDQVRVVRIKYNGREKSTMHQHRPGAVVFLTDCDFKFSYPDGKSEEVHGKAGETLTFTDVWEHLPENLTDAPFEGVYVEVKS